MPRSGGKRARRVGIPAGRSILEEKLLVPPRKVTAGVAMAAGPTYRILRTSEVDGYDKALKVNEISSFGVARFAGLGDEFRGTARKAAKLSIASATTKPFGELRALLDTLVPDNVMSKRKPKISKDAKSRRVSEEDRNVRVRAFLYAASREDDNDYHLIIGRARRASPPKYMTIEISGLPAKSSAHFGRMKAARDAYKAFFTADLPGASYDFYDPPIPIEVEGSLFFDVSHASGSRPGPQTLRPHMPTVWEIHPVSRIVFEP